MSTETLYDVCIAGAGPSGATCAFYLAQAGKKVLLLEKRQFPREKICGDAVCVTAQKHLTAMGVLQEIEKEGQGNWSELGGLVAPSGAGFIGNSVNFSGRQLVIAIKRHVMDEKVARAAQKAGADLREHHAFTGATLDKVKGEWTVRAKVAEGDEVTFRAKALVAADGAHSHVTQALGIPTPPPDGICSRAYVKAGTHQFDADGVAFYTDELIPGYAAIFKEADGDVNFCVYLIPGGRATQDDLKRLHETLLKEHPYISKAMGPNAQIARMQGAPLRLGGKVKSYYERLLVVGDAAGHIDPLTGEGIHTAMEGGWLAAEVLLKALDSGDLSEARLQDYEARWMKAFGNDFRWSAVMAKVYTRFPIFVEASARVMQKKGASVLYDWGKMMTGAAPKTGFLSPRMFMPVLVETAKLLLSGRKPGEVHYVVDGRKKTWQADLKSPARAA